MPPNELRFYASERGLTVPFTATKNSIKAQLEQADDNATFDRFTELPPELRQIIFEYYMDSTLANRRPKSIYQPPLTMTSRMIREESLPLFYDCWDVELASEGPITSPYKLHPSATTARFLQNTPTHLLARIKSFDLIFDNLNFRVAIDLRKQNPIGTVYIFHGGYWEWELKTNEATRSRKQHLLSALHTLAISMAARPGPPSFRLSDVDEVGETFRRIIIDETATQ